MPQLSFIHLKGLVKHLQRQKLSYLYMMLNEHPLVLDGLSHKVHILLNKVTFHGSKLLRKD
ncbi:hypothetical protein M422DRAFT_259417 [Sphaerobolus stellatus SS14]|uniref:Unplaced genomic scaffold SPHSTscaffold_89, whole genome shotgun sequence n=1 Tax=Sphaerobolus stellatus (strain SS14) TaxID=990650 RepID=A0A0C9VK00_SPHS4|nr:hypothetical protein M422DRAFT_259417 [Sphaerobolus stellatus SS14]